MWFKNLRIYKLTEAVAKLHLDEILERFQFVPCGSLDPVRYGFFPPLGKDYLFTHDTLNFTMICAKREDKILPASAINQAVEEKAKAIAEAESRNVGRKERQTIRDEVIFSMLPKAFSRVSLDYAYIDHAEQLIIVNSSSAKRAEDLLSKLREALGSLRCIPLSTKNIPTQVMTHWLQTNTMPDHFELGEECELQAGKDGRVIRCKKQDLTANEILSHINSGMYVNKIALNYREGISFVLDDQLSIKKLKFDDVISEKSNERNPESKAEQFDADFAVMAVELTALIKDLLVAFGGESEPV